MNKTIFHFALSFCLLIFAFLIFAVNTASAATLYFSPASGNQTAGNIMTVNVLVNSQGQAINSADTIITYPINYLEVVSISKSGSIFSLWVEEPTFSNGSGTINLSGGLPTPGYNGTAGKIIGITFRLKTAGTASLVFSSASVRANDGYGTNVLLSASPASYNITAPVKVEPPPEPKPVPVPVVAPEPVKETVEEPVPVPEPVVEKVPEPVVVEYQPSTFEMMLEIVLTPIAISIIIILILIILLFYGRHRFVQLRADVRRETREVERALHRSLTVVKADVTASVSLLEKTKNRRRLTEEEKEVSVLLKRHVQETEKLMAKELEDIRQIIED